MGRQREALKTQVRVPASGSSDFPDSSNIKSPHGNALCEMNETEKEIHRRHLKNLNARDSYIPSIC